MFIKLKGGNEIIIITLIILSLVAVIANAQELTGNEILEKIKGKISLAGSGVASINLITENKKGQQRSNTIKIYRKTSEKTEKQLIEYLEPAEVKGTKFLSIIEKGKEAIMWLYLPALGRERRIAAHAKKKSFMGTDFTYEEIGGGKSYEEKYEAKRLKDEVFQNYPCYVLKLYPKEKEAEYTYLKMWIWKEEFFPLRIEFYKEEGKLTKVLTNSDLRKEKDKYMSYKIVMADAIKGSKTIIKILESKEEELSDDYFTLRYLRRG